MMVFSYLQKCLLVVVKNSPKKWDFLAQFISLRKSLLKGLTIRDNDFGGVFHEPPPNDKIASNFPFSGGNKLPVKANLDVVKNRPKKWTFWA